jgi:hypothetical protein
LHFVDTAVGHGFTAGRTGRKGVVFVGAITVLFGGIVKEASTSFKIFGIIFGSARVDIGTKKGLGHG